MSMTQKEKEHLAGRVVAVLRGDDPRVALEGLRRKVEAGDEGDDGLNSTVLAIAQALMEHLRR